VLANFFKISEGGLLAFEDGAHATECSAFEALAAIKGVTVLDHANHVTSDGVYESSSGIDLTQRQLVVISIVEGVTEVGIKGMNIVESRKVAQDLPETFRDGLLRELDLSHARAKRRVSLGLEAPLKQMTDRRKTY
jgi:hypothetical protein